MIDFKKILSPNVRRTIMNALSFLPDEPYIRLFFYVVTGRKLNLKNPVTFEDKQQWLKLHNKHDEYRDLADKLKVRAHIREALGEEYLVPLLGTWKRFEDIDFSKLPNRFVLKCNHDSGSARLIRDKEKLSEQDYAELKKHFNRRVKKDFFYAGREYPYKGIEPFIMAEEFLEDKREERPSPNDYKFFCFAGVPKIVLVVTDRATDACYDFYDMDFKHLNVIFGKQSEKTNTKPAFFDRMKDIAAQLSKEMRFVRIDLYEINNQIYFGEYTFFDGGGFQFYKPKEWEYRMGEWIDLG